MTVPIVQSVLGFRDNRNYIYIYTHWFFFLNLRESSLCLSGKHVITTEIWTYYTK